MYHTGLERLERECSKHMLMLNLILRSCIWLAVLTCTLHMYTTITVCLKQLAMIICLHDQLTYTRISRGL